MSPFLLGIAGGSGSGKSTIVEQLLASPLAEHISLLSHDAYYKNADHMPSELRDSQNWDHPDALDNELFLQHVQDLLSGQPIARPVYDFATHSRTEQTVTVTPKPILLLEGILLFAINSIREHIALRVYIDTPADVRVVRRMVRDISERERSVQSVADQYQTTVRPMHNRFVEPSRVHAHLVVPWLDYNEAAIETIVARLAYEIR